MKKILLFVILFNVILLCGCGNDYAEDEFAEQVNKAQSYVSEGLMESFYDNGKKENKFKVYYKSPDLIKVIIQSDENEQVILKNNEGVFILIPSVNKNFKVDSTWPTNASYPYLLQSLVKDLANDKDFVKTQTDSIVTIETKSKMFADANATKQKIVIDKNTNLPTEVLVYDQNGNLYIRCLYTKIEIDANISDDEFLVKTSLLSLRKEDLTIFKSRVFSMPSYIPEGYQTSPTDSVVTNTSNGLVSITKYSGDDSFTIIQEFINDSKDQSTIRTDGEIFTVLGNVALYDNTSIEVYYQGINYTLASKGLAFEEMVKILSSYFYTNK